MRLRNMDHNLGRERPSNTTENDGMTAPVRRELGAIALTTMALLFGCGGDDAEDAHPEACSVEEQTGCAPGLVCETVSGGETACFCSVEGQTGCDEGLACETVVDGHSECFAPVTVEGDVFDLATEEPVAGARVVARDANSAAASGVAVTDENGHYALAVPTPRRSNGTLVPHSVTLRADAAGYLGFPRAPRVALPIALETAAGDPPAIETSATSIGLVALAETESLGTVSGKVVAGEPWGTVVVAGGATAVADRDGSYTVFNVPVGSVTAEGYKIGLQLDSTTVAVRGGEAVEGVDLKESGEANAVVSGKIEIVNAFGGATTSVILALADTFDETAARGEAPPGLRVGDIAGDFRIEGVPNGRYVVLAAFENDRLVRDPDTSIGGTSIVRVDVVGSSMALSDGFKVTEALQVVSPDGEREISGTPTFVWKDDSGEDHYEVRVFDAFGNLVWQRTDVPNVNGNSDVSVSYGGPSLEPGMLYQFRATSIKRGGAPIAITEDLRGVFVYR